jgi:hypothetical protein
LHILSLSTDFSRIILEKLYRHLITVIEEGFIGTIVKEKIRLIHTICLVVMFVAACGGDGANNTELTPLVYKGIADAAVITTGNAGLLVNNVLDAGYLSTSIDVLSANILETPLNTAVTQQISRLRKHLNHTQGKLVGRLQGLAQTASRTVNITERCVDQGNLHYSGELNENGTGLLTVDIDNCTDSGESMDGQMNNQGQIQIKSFILCFLAPTNRPAYFFGL